MGEWKGSEEDGDLGRRQIGIWQIRDRRGCGRAVRGGQGSVVEEAPKCSTARSSRTGWQGSDRNEMRQAGVVRNGVLNSQVPFRRGPQAACRGGKRQVQGPNLWMASKDNPPINKVRFRRTRKDPEGF